VNAKQTVRQSAPAGVACLGYGGLIPFVALAAVIWLDTGYSHPWRFSLVAYGAVILSFVGALHWGFAMCAGAATESDLAAGRNPALGTYIWSVVPALVGWVAVLLAQEAPRTSALPNGLLIGGFVIHYAIDRQIARRLKLPSWYLPMRLRLTAVACLSLVSAVFR
jgi:uncharacterized membrane protein